MIAVGTGRRRACHERSRWWERPGGKVCLLVAAQGCGCSAKGVDEGGVGRDGRRCGSLGRGVGERGGSVVGLNWAIVGIAGRGCDRFPHSFRVGAFGAGLGFDRGDEVGAGSAVTSGRQTTPRGQRRQVDVVSRGERAWDDVLAAATRVELGGAIVPSAGERLACCERADAGKSRPIGHRPGPLIGGSSDARSPTSAVKLQFTLGWCGW
jgi:hypothetical protein